ncbi:Signal transduction histidine-protein kinase BaeS [Thalassocella blandensis]|nr:Signal transduction histidine-protein kinase BaeS [Thalassocella blandensis]
MRLRKQLFFLSLITLSLPWVGVQYVQEMYTALRHGQSEALTATARAVAARIGSDPLLSKELHRFTSTGSNSVYYAHELQSPLIIDGYSDDWNARNFTLNTGNSTANANSGFSYAIARTQTTLFAFVKVNKFPIKYFNPARPNAANLDFIRLDLSQGTAVALYASAPGQLYATAMDEDGSLESKNVIHAIKGIWLEQQDGYQIEFHVPLDWVQEGIQLQRIDAGTLTDAPVRLSPLVSVSEALSDELAVFASSQIRLLLSSDQQLLVGTAGDISARPSADKQHGLLEWVYRLLLSDQSDGLLDTPQITGEFQTADVQQALRGQSASGWYQNGRDRIARASFPVTQHNSSVVLGAVVAEQSADTLAGITNSVFSRILGYSFVTSCIAALCLVIYATWLSFRIKRLSKAAANAISDTGKVTDNFPVSTSADEIGELSRSFAQLLLRLKEYTNYLRTLSSKLSHELRTPLAIVKTSLDNLEHEKLSKQAKIYAERAKEGSTRLSNILNSMSAASRVEQAITAAELETIPCDELITSLKDAYEDVYPHVQFSLRLQPRKGGIKMLGSGELIVQLLDKLVDNAADFCPPGGVVELGLYQHDNDVVFTVHNEGPPLPKHMQNQLFDSMVSVREDASPEQKGHHLGLGLYIVRLITDFHRGEVQGYNVPDNSGVIFEVRFPADV